jgi:hypothetical protein
MRMVIFRASKACARAPTRVLMHALHRAKVWRLSTEVERQLGSGPRYPLRVLRTIIRVLYSQKGYHGNTIGA